MKKVTKKKAVKKSKLPPRVQKEDVKRVKELNNAFKAINRMEKIHLKIQYKFLTDEERKAVDKIQSSFAKAYLVLAKKKTFILGKVVSVS